MLRPHEEIAMTYINQIHEVEVNHQRTINEVKNLEIELEEEKKINEKLKQ